jgi:hypothetical protein
MSAGVLAKGATPLDPRQDGDGSGNRNANVRRTRDQACNRLPAAGISLAGSLGVTGALWVVLWWLG